MLHTYLTDHLGLRYPIIGAPMAGVAGGRLARAISLGGGFGMVGIANYPVGFVQQEAAIAGEGGTAFGIGLLLWVIERHPELVDAAIAAKPRIISLSFGDPSPYIDRIHRAGILVAKQVNSVADARVAEEAGVDLIVAQGTEAGGHSNRVEIATLPLLQGVLDSVRAPVITAGGIASARGLAAVLTAGAAGAWIGTAFLASPEGSNTDDARRRVIGAQETDTVLTDVFDRATGSAWPVQHPGRALRNSFTEEWHGHTEHMLASEEAMARFQQARAEGDYDTAMIYAGQAVGMVRDVLPAGEVVRQIGDGAEALLRGRIAGLLG